MSGAGAADGGIRSRRQDVGVWYRVAGVPQLGQETVVRADQVRLAGVAKPCPFDHGPIEAGQARPSGDDTERLAQVGDGGTGHDRHLAQGKRVGGLLEIGPSHALHEIVVDTEPFALMAAGGRQKNGALVVHEEELLEEAHPVGSPGEAPLQTSVGRPIGVGGGRAPSQGSASPAGRSPLKGRCRG